ncbi:MAG: sigma-54 dependent transcriptional regulator [Lentisphaeraceae bacterium]|nr:sigma-54 dependent transcriptional regulator [Lentisphaeraceae bacterium]
MIDRILVADDEFMIREVLEETIRRHNIEVITASNGDEAKKMLEKHDCQMAFVDLKMGKTTGMDVLKHCQAKSPSTLFVLMTAYGTVETAVDAIKMGAYDFILKPFSPDQTDVLIEKANKWLQMSEKQIYLNKELDKEIGFLKEILGKSTEIQKINKLIHRVAKSDVTVLVTGESGTGKELVSSAIENVANPGKKAPYIRMNCAAVPENLIESEMFGHEKGAFTGANERRIGRFELADGGTLLLDEIGEVPLSMQAKLLRVLQESEFERVGGNKTIKVNVRIIATTNRDLKTEVEKGNFREDLFYRLNVVPIKVPPLRERSDDCKVIANKMLDRIAKKQSRDLHFAKDTLDCMASYPWPGNVRELENFIERLGVLEDGPEICIDAMPDYIRNPEVSGKSSSGSGSSFDTLNLHDIERETIKRALIKTKGNRSKAADLLGFSVRTLRNKLTEYKSTGEWDTETQVAI